MEIQTRQLAPNSVLLAVRLDLEPGLESERLEVLAGSIRRGLAALLPPVGVNQTYLDITDATSASRQSAKEAYDQLREATRPPDTD